jgi:D-xylose transport system substrate-binding protein
VKSVSRRTVTLLAGVTAAAVAVAIVASGATARSSATVLVCGLMPDTKTSTRWELKDRPALEKAFKAAGVPARIVNAQGSAQTQKTQADQCIADGAKVLIIAPLDAGSAAAIEKSALKQGVKSIDYDRQVEGGVAALYTSFDGRVVGVQQAKSVILGLKKNGTYGKKPVIASLWGGSEDANAHLFKSGVDATLNPLYKNGTLVKGPQQFVPAWNNQTAGTIFQQMLIKTSNKIDGVAAANDGIANAVVVDLKAAGLDPLPLSGQDATTQGVQNVIAGWQTATVWKDERKLAAATATAAIRLAKGQKPPTTGVVKTKGRKLEPAYLISTKMITKANWKQLLTSGYYKRSDICNGSYTKYC